MVEEYLAVEEHLGDIFSGSYTYSIYVVLPYTYTHLHITIFIGYTGNICMHPRRIITAIPSQGTFHSHICI